MESIQTPMKTQDLIAAIGTRSHRLGQSVAGEMSADPFMQIIQNMMQQMTANGQQSDINNTPGVEQGTAATTDEMLRQLLGGILGQTAVVDKSQDFAELLGGEQTPDKSVDLRFAQCIAGMMQANPDMTATQLIEHLTETNAIDDTKIAQLTALAATQSPAEGTKLATDIPDWFLILATGMQGSGVDKEIGKPLPLELQRRLDNMQNTAYNAKNTSSIPVSEAGYTSETVGDSGVNQLLSAQQQFQNAVNQAKFQMKLVTDANVRDVNANTPETPMKTSSKTSDIDVDRLQNDASLAKAAFPELTIKQAGTAEQPKLLDQLTKNISENISTGKNEFVVKLKPESLGEITVKLVERDGKMTLSISTASADTARIINSELAALREAVRPMQVEVREAVSQSAGASQSEMQQFNMAGQQFSNQQGFFNGQQTNRQARHTSSFQSEFMDGEATNEAVAEPRAIRLGALDTYV